jgi:uncharacterized membrane protein
MVMLMPWSTAARAEETEKFILVLLYLTPSLIRSLSYQSICGFVHLSSVCQQRENQKNTEDTIQQKMSATVLL